MSSRTSWLSKLRIPPTDCAAFGASRTSSLRKPPQACHIRATPTIGHCCSACQSTRPRVNIAHRCSRLHERRANAHAQRKPYATDASSAGHGAGVYHTLDDTSPGNTVATITLHNPAKLNIVTTSLLKQLIQTCDDLANNPSLRAVILTGSPPPSSSTKQSSFIGGADIHQMHALNGPAEAREFITTIHQTCNALRHTLPVPVIARINGFCLGAGLEIAAACDMRVATAASVFGMPEVAVGIPSVVEAALLPGLIGWGRTRRLVHLAERIGGAEAERWGLLEKVVKDEAELDRAVEEWVGMLVGMGPKAIRSQKRLMLEWERRAGVEGAIEDGIEAFADAFEDGGQEPKEFMGNFLHRKRR